MTVVAVGSVHQRAGDLPDAVHVNEEERDDRQGCGGGQRAGGGAADVTFAAGENRDQLADGQLPEQIAKQDEEEQRPEKRQEAISVFLQRGTENFQPEELENRFEKVPRSARRA